MIYLDNYAREVHKANEKWWVSLDDNSRILRNKGELLMLVVFELSEALEGDRKGLMDDKLPQYKMFDVEIVDALIRLFDIAGAYIPNLEEIYQAKMEYNKNREDHSLDHRKSMQGKKY